jgi:hypothetical protein
MTESDLVRLHMAQQHWDKAQRFTAPATYALDPRRVLARRVERIVRERIEALGIRCAKTGHTRNFDLLAQGVRVEVKASRWDGVRYEANLRSNDADVLVFGCLDGELHFFVIPFDQVAGRTVIKITSHDPRDYLGRFMRYYEAWDLLNDLIRAGRNAWQPELLGASA